MKSTMASLFAFAVFVTSVASLSTAWANPQEQETITPGAVTKEFIYTPYRSPLFKYRSVGRALEATESKHALKDLNSAVEAYGRIQAVVKVLADHKVSAANQGRFIWTARNFYDLTGVSLLGPGAAKVLQEDDDRDVKVLSQNFVNIVTGADSVIGAIRVWSMMASSRSYELEKPYLFGSKFIDELEKSGRLTNEVTSAIARRIGTALQVNENDAYDRIQKLAAEPCFVFSDEIGHAAKLAQALALEAAKVDAATSDTNSDSTLPAAQQDDGTDSLDWNPLKTDDQTNQPGIQPR